MEVCAPKPPSDPAGCCGVAVPTASAGLAPNKDVPVAPVGLKLNAGADVVASAGAAVDIPPPNAGNAGAAEDVAVAPKLGVGVAPKIEPGLVVATALAAGAAGVEKSPVLNEGAANDVWVAPNKDGCDVPGCVALEKEKPDAAGAGVCCCWPKIEDVGCCAPKPPKVVAPKAVGCCGLVAPTAG